MLGHEHLEKFTVEFMDGSARDLLFPGRNALVIGIDIIYREAYPIRAIQELIGGGAVTVVDIGANAGAFSFAAGLSWPGSRIYCFEPAAASFACLRHNLAHLPNAAAFQFGLGDGDHAAKLYDVGYGAVGASVGSSGLTLGEREVVVIRDAGATMAELGIGRIDILKIDTEGCELPIMRSMRDLVATARIIFIEYHSDEDRRGIDAVLRPTHILHSAKAEQPHRGELCYIVNDLGGRWDGSRIVLPGDLA